MVGVGRCDVTALTVKWFECGDRQLLAVGEVLEAAALDAADGQATASVRTRLHRLLA